VRITIDIESEEGKFSITTTVRGSAVNGSHTATGIDPDKIGDAVGLVVQRIAERRSSTISAPEGMRFVPVGINWLAFSEVEVAVPTDTSDDGDELREAIRLSIKRDGLPEVVDNPTLSFIDAVSAHAPRGPEGFIIAPETEIDL
jgi:hypothetical protein